MNNHEGAHDEYQDEDDENHTPHKDELMKLLEKKHARFVVSNEQSREI